MCAFIVFYSFLLLHDHIANEVFDMNHEATRLTAHLTVLRRTSQSVSDSLTQFQETRDRKKAEREKEKTERLEYLNEAIASSQVELDVSSLHINLYRLFLSFFLNNI